MSEETGKGQLDLWEKLNRLYGDKDPGQDGENPAAEEDEPLSPDDDSGAGVPGISGVEDFGSGVREDAPEAPPNKGLNAAAPPRRPGGGYRSPAKELGRVNDTCCRCRRSCKQTGQKLNHMLCIGFLPIED